MKLQAIKNRGDIPAFLQTLGDELLLCEVGVFYGEHMRSLLRCLPQLLLAVDAWQPTRWYTEKQMAQARAAAHQVAEQNTCVRIVEGQSLDVAADQLDGTFDFVYIDASHDYRSVSDDLAAWWPKVKAGGVLAGHDYVMRVSSVGQVFEVVQAVHEFVGRYDLRGQFHTTWPSEGVGNWFIEKQ